MPLFETRTIDDHADSLANYLPGGELFEAKFLPDKKLRKYLRALAAELDRYHSVLEESATEHEITKTQSLINEWESAMGIPGTCFDNKGTIEERRRNVLIKLIHLHGSTAQDFINLAQLLGYTILVEPARYHGLLETQFPIYFYDSGKTVMFSVIITLPPDQKIAGFPLSFAFPFMLPNNALLQCIFNRMKPANVNVHYLFKDLISSIGNLPAPGSVVTNALLMEDVGKFLLEQGVDTGLELENSPEAPPAPALWQTWFTNWELLTVKKWEEGQ